MIAPASWARRALHAGLTVIVLATASLAALLAFGVLSGQWRVTPVLSGSMEPNVPKGALVVAEEVAVSHLRVGDVLLFRAPTQGRPPTVHRIHQILHEHRRRAFRTKGDANDGPDAWTIRIRTASAWRVARVIPKAGTIVEFFRRADLRMVLLLASVGTLTVGVLLWIWTPTASRMRGRRRRARRVRGLPEVTAAITIVVAVAAAVTVVTSGMAYGMFNDVPTVPAPTYATGALAAPTALGCTWTSATALQLSWVDASPSFTTGYDARRANTSGGPYSSIGTTAGETSTSVTDNAPGPPTLRYYVVLATHGTWTSAAPTEVASKSCRRAIVNVAGTGIAGSTGDGGAATAALLNAPQGVAVDGNGNVYIADTGNNKVRKVDTTGTITTFAGTGMSGSMGDGGSATSARLSAPRDVAVDGSGNVYIADTGNNKVRKVDTGGVITTFAGGGATTACTASGSPTAVSMSGPRGIAVDSAGAVYVADTGRNCIRKIAAGSLSQVAGGGASSGCAFAGSATAAVLNTPSDVAVDASGAVYVADTANNCVRKVAAGAISLLAGNGANTACAFVGAATSASLSGPLGVTVDSSGRIVIADSGRNCVRLVTGTNVELMAGTGTAGSTGDNGPAIAALVNAPNGVAASSTGAVWVADTSNNRVRRVVGPF